MPGRLIVLEGLDGSGKATQAERLTAILKERGYPVRKLSFPDYASDSSALVRMYLRGDFGTDPGAVNAYAASLFFTVDRCAGMLRDWGAFYQEDGILVADRYTTSNAVHQCCKLPAEEWDGYLDWLFELEYRYVGLPEPDLVLYLRLPPDEAEQLIGSRYHGDEGKKDIHERDDAYLRSAHKAAEYCASKCGWHTVDCLRASALRSVDDIHAEVLQTVLNLLGTARTD